MSPRMTEVEIKLARAYTMLVCNHPFFATILLRLRKVNDPTCKTMWTDGKRLGYSPKFVESLPLDEVVGVLCHEVGHVASLHPWRRMRRKPKPWNIACDAVVNHWVTAAGLKLPANCIPPIADKCAEEIYMDLPGDDGSDGDGEGDFAGAVGEVRDATNEDGSEMDNVQREIAEGQAKVMVQQAYNAAKAAGKLPAGMERWVKDTLEPKVPWREILARFIDGQSRNDYSWLRPNRRYVMSGMMFPSLYSPGYGEVIMACDTSGSIDQETLREIASEVLGCLNVYAERGQNPALTVLWCDTAVTPQVIEDADELVPVGGGGPSFAPVFAHIREEDLTPKAVIYATDGECSDFGEEPACPALWILTRPNSSFEPPFGELVCTLNE